MGSLTDGSHDGKTPSANVHPILPGSVGAPGPLLSAPALRSLQFRLPTGPSPLISADQSSPHAPGSTVVGSVAPRALGVSGIMERLRAQSPAPVAPGPGIYQVPIGWFAGFVNDSVDRLGIGGLAIQVYSPALCSSSRCTAASTSSNGSFTIPCAAPGGPGDNDAIVLTTNNWYFDNVSYASCTANQTTNVGTIYLVRDAVGIGFVKDPITGKPIAGVQVQAITRDGTFLGYPAAVTNSNGSFVVGLPPIPAKVVLTPPAGYEGTFNYTDAGPGTGTRPSVPPWYGGVNMGTFYLVRQTLVAAHLVDAQTNGSITTEGSALTACDAFGSGCNPQGIGVVSSRVTAFANPGWNYFKVYSQDHVESATVAQLIPQEAPGTAYDIGKVYLQPIAAFDLDTGISDPAGGSVPWAGGGFASASICGLDGYQFSFLVPSGTFFSSAFNMTSGECATVGPFYADTVQLLPGLPLRDLVSVNMATVAPTWTNFTYVNLTAGHRLASPDPVQVNFSIGDYVAGKVLVDGTAAPPSTFTVTETSTDNQVWDTSTFTYNYPRDVANYGTCATVQPWTAAAFCIAVPPGNAQITVTAPGYGSNWTWVHTPNFCCRADKGTGWPASLAQATRERVQVINLSP
ncbi:MAG: carboxypeptidase-like regulatory domain-containing protein, partial [Thermoplasmata archaeon]|nr:carboxypeptidase-like regulatory domain-containing protein [Thermoplasmata archaeon]